METTQPESNRSESDRIVLNFKLPVSAAQAAFREFEDDKVPCNYYPPHFRNTSYFVEPGVVTYQVAAGKRQTGIRYCVEWLGVNKYWFNGIGPSKCSKLASGLTESPFFGIN